MSVRMGRRRGNPDTRGQILEAARAEFGDRGYDGASMRGIAARANVDPALVHHYFGSKERLFAAAVELPFSPEDIASAISAAPRLAKGERLTRTFFAVWEDPARRIPVLALFRTAMVHESAALLIRQFARRVMVGRVAASLSGPDPELRLEAAVSHLFGLAFTRYVIKIEPLASATEDELVDLVAPVIQKYLD